MRNGHGQSAQRLFHFGIVAVSNRALMIAGMRRARSVSKVGDFARTPVDRWSCGKLILRGSPDVVRADNDVTERVAVLFSGGKVHVQQPGTFRSRRAFFQSAKLVERFRQSRIGLSISLDGGGDFVERFESLLFVARN